MKFVMESNEVPGLTSELDFNVKVWLSSCNKVWRWPSNPAETLDRTYVIKSAPVTIDFTDIDLTNCPF